LKFDPFFSMTYMVLLPSKSVPLRERCDSSSSSMVYYVYYANRMLHILLVTLGEEYISTSTAYRNRESMLVVLEERSAFKSQVACNALCTAACSTLCQPPIHHRPDKDARIVP